jgi:hypothetical protein
MRNEIYNTYKRTTGLEPLIRDKVVKNWYICVLRDVTK